MELSIIIPTYNDGNTIGRLLTEIAKHGKDQELEIIVVDGGSKDITVRRAKEHPVEVLVSPKTGKASQMNYGAAHASGKVLYFVHAHVVIHPDFYVDIRSSIFNGYEAGCYRLEYSSASPVLKINSFFTRFEAMIFRGGDQTLFITRELFDVLHGYNESFGAFEDYDMIKRIRRIARFRIISKNVLASAKKFDAPGWFRYKLVNVLVLGLLYLKTSPAMITKAYRLMLGN
jgi:rSAM/selenodomain-associated transferase 2